MSVRIEADNARRNARQHRFGKTAAEIELAVGFDKIAALRFQLAGHAVKGAAEKIEFIIAFPLGHRHARAQDRRRARGRRRRSNR